MAGKRCVECIAPMGLKTMKNVRVPWARSPSSRGKPVGRADGIPHAHGYDLSPPPDEALSKKQKTIYSKTERGRYSLAMPLASLALFIVFSIPSDSRGLFHFPRQFTYFHFHLREGNRFKSESRGQILKGLYYAERRNRGV